MPFFHTPSFDSIEPILPNTPVEIEPSQRLQRTAAAPINIEKDIRIIYRYFFIIGFLFIMIIFGLSAIIYSSLKVDQCQSITPSDLTMIIIFGLVDISICSLALIFVFMNLSNILIIEFFFVCSRLFSMLRIFIVLMIKYQNILLVY